MGLFCHDDNIDAMLDAIAAGVNLTFCSAEPANYADIANVDLATVVVTAGDGNGDFVIANGDTSGRKLTLAAQSGVSITTSGDCDHAALDDGAKLLYVLTCTSQTLTSGGDVASNAVDIEVADPTAA